MYDRSKRSNLGHVCTFYLFNVVRNIHTYFLVYAYGGYVGNNRSMESNF